MASLDSLPPDQRAVLDLVLQRGRSYDDIARLLAIDRAAVRARALAAFDEIGPDTGLAPEARALITDYLLGQLPAKVAEQTRDRLAESPYERAWARVLASELSPVASKPLPEIPEGAARARAGTGADDASSKPAAQASTKPEARAPRRPERARESGRRIPRPTDRPSSRIGGVIFLLVGTIVVIVVVLALIVVLSGGKSNKSSSTGTVAAGTSTSTPSTTTPSGGTGTGTGTGTTGTSTVKPKVLGQVNMNPPSGSGAAKGAALVVQEGTSTGIILEASGLQPNSHNAYAVWLSNTPTDSTRLGFVNQAVGKNGRLETGGALPANATHYTKLLLTLETQSNPKTPGTTVLQGTFKITGS
jgi:hypothetical protein